MDSEQRDRVRIESDRLLAAYGRRPAGDTRYSWFDDGHRFLMQQRERAVLRALARESLDRLAGLRVLEIGCGNGNGLRDIERWGGSAELLTGVDRVPGRVREAARRGPPGAGYLIAGGTELPFRSGSFDLVLQSTVFSSILDAAVRRQVADEMVRVLQRRGCILWYDYHWDNPSNPDVRGIPRGELRRLFAGCTVSAARVSLAPPLARRLARVSWIGCLLLDKLPLLRSHTLAVVRPLE